MSTISHTSTDFVEDLKGANMCVALVVKGEEQHAGEISSNMHGLLA